MTYAVLTKVVLVAMVSALGGIQVSGEHLSAGSG